MKSSTVRLRLTGMTVRHAVSAIITATPLAFIGQTWLTRHFLPSTPMIAGAGVLALVPWLGRAWVRHRAAAKCDDIAVHVGGEALPYKMIKSARIERGARRHVLVLERSAEIVLRLIWWDAVAGSLTPAEVLRERLMRAGRTIDD